MKDSTICTSVIFLGLQQNLGYNQQMWWIVPCMIYRFPRFWCVACDPHPPHETQGQVKHRHVVQSTRGGWGERPCLKNGFLLVTFSSKAIGAVWDIEHLVDCDSTNKVRFECEPSPPARIHKSAYVRSKSPGLKTRNTRPPCQRMTYGNLKASWENTCKCTHALYRDELLAT